MGKETMKFSEQSELMKVLYENIQSNERLRNNLFALYMAISAAFFGFGDKNASGDDSVFGRILFPLLAWGAGVLFLGAFVRYKEMIRRDVDLAALLQKKLYQRDPELLNLHQESHNNISSKHRHVTSVSTALVLLTLVVSVAILTILLHPFFKDLPKGFSFITPTVISFLVNFGAFLLYGGSIDTFSDRVGPRGKAVQREPARKKSS